jgi:hypothetical protein
VVAFGPSPAGWPDTRVRPRGGRREAEGCRLTVDDQSLEFGGLRVVFLALGLLELGARVFTAIAKLLFSVLEDGDRPSHKVRRDLRCCQAEAGRGVRGEEPLTA